MTKEQEKAIERCNKLTETEHSNWIGISNQKAIETVLNMLKEKDKEIQFQKDINKTEKDRHKQTERSLKGQIWKKDKMIDLMAEQLIRVPINKSKRNFEEPNFEEEIIIFADKEYIKQYFKRKVEDE